MNARTVCGALVLVVSATLAGCGGADQASSGSRQGTRLGVSELDSATEPPWPAPSAGVPALVAAAGLNLGPMGTAEHYHPRLTLRINGELVPVPPNIGVDPATGAMSAVHTHEADGTIHVEADTVGQRFTLGQVFAQWGIAFSANQIGGVPAPPGKAVSVTSNGEPVRGDPTDLRLAPEQHIVVEIP